MSELRSAVARPRPTVLVVAVLLAACSSSTVGTSSASTPTVVATEAPEPTEEPTPNPIPAIVGTWLGMHNCQRIVDTLTAAGMPEQALLNAAESGTIPGVSRIEEIADPDDPCVGATDMAHWHFFNANGEFGSLDMNRQRVDDGRWTLIDVDAIDINGTRFTFQVDRDELRLQPEAVGMCPTDGQWCLEAWKVMVAMPGLTWTRDE